MRKLIVASVIVTVIAAVALTACDGASRPPTLTPDPATSTPKPFTATPTPLFTVTEAESRVQEYAARDINLPAETDGTKFVCGSKEDRYSAERKTWVIHCNWFDFPSRRSDVQTARASGRTPLPIQPMYEKTYLLDDITGKVRE